MTTLTIEIPDNKAEQISKLIEQAGGNVISKIDDKLSKKDKQSLAKALEEAELIKQGKLKPLTFNELWD